MKTKVDRNQLRAEYNNQRGSSKTKFSDKEQQALNKILKLKDELLNDNDLNLYSKFFKNRKKFHECKLFNVLKKMPKGVIQHLHNPAGADIELFYELMKDKRVFLDTKENILKVILDQKEDKFENYERVSSLIKKIGLEKVKEKVDQRIIFGEEKFDAKNTKEIFDKFASSFDSLFLGFYQPFFESLIKSTFSTLQQDNVQAVEIRNVFNLMQREKDLSIMDFEEELDFQQKVFAKISSEFEMPYKLYHCGLKNIGKDNIQETLNQYTSSLKTHPNFITGYDMVHYEGYLLIEEVYDKLYKAKQQCKNITYCFHAGESLDNNNYNVIDSISLGSKRIGHGLQVANSSFLIELVKKNDICVEVNPLSNYMLGYVRDLNNHPAKILMQSGVKISISPDDYIIFGEKGTTMDFFLSVVYFQFDLKDLKWCLQNSIDYSVFESDFSHALLAPSKIKKIDEIPLEQKCQRKKLSKAIQIALQIQQGQRNAQQELQIFDKAKPTRKSVKSTQIVSKKDTPSHQSTVQVLEASQDTILEQQKTPDEILEHQKMTRKFSQFSVLQDNNKSQFIERVNDFMEDIDNFLNCLNKLFDSEIDQFHHKIQELQQTIMSLNGRSLYRSQIGISLNLFKKSIERKQCTSQQRKCVKNYAQFLQNLQEKILNEFTECSEIELLSQLQLQNQLQNSELNSKVEINNQIFMAKNHTKAQEEEHKNSDELTHSSAVRFELEDRVIFRVQKKIGKVIYLNGGKGTLRKMKCELLASKIEDYIRKGSRGLEEYKSKARVFVKNFDKQPDKVKKYIVSQSQASNAIPFLENIERFLEEQLITFNSKIYYLFKIPQHSSFTRRNYSNLKLKIELLLDLLTLYCKNSHFVFSYQTKADIKACFNQFF